MQDYEKEIRKAYLAVIKEASKLARTAKLDSNGFFFFSKNRAIEKKIDELIQKFNDQVYAISVTSINSNWDLAVEKNNEIAYQIFGKSLAELPVKYKKKYLSNNEDAVKGFIQNKINGLDLSDRVWRNSQQFKAEIELALQVGISNGTSATKIASDMTQYLKEPNKLFRRVRDAAGNLRLPESAKAYNPGRGLYRSSYKNAFRLTRSENNAAYEKSNELKRNQQDFVVGLNISVSKSHDPKDDKNGISCEALQGNYPKDFDWSYKWHPQCKCISKTILKTQPEVLSDIERIANGKEPTNESVNKVNEIPKNFTDYAKANKKQWDGWKNQPRFMVNLKE